MKPPHWLLALSEAPRAMVDYSTLALSRPLLRKMPRGDGHGVMVIPGFMGDDPFNQPLVDFLNQLGYRATGWQLGRNLGPGSFSREDLEARLADLVEAGGGKVSIIGHSLGGIYAREIARAEPNIVRQVITLGSPFGKGRDSGSNASRLYQRMNPNAASDPEQEARQAQLAVAPPVPTTAIYTRGDGVVNWRTSLQRRGLSPSQNIEVPGSHIGLTINPAVWYLLADRLQQAANDWQPHDSGVFHTPLH
jgi:pimeloyl-ACP methyl ester carboxylesterase